MQVQQAASEYREGREQAHPESSGAKQGNGYAGVPLPGRDRIGAQRQVLARSDRSPA